MRDVEDVLTPGGSWRLAVRNGHTFFRIRIETASDAQRRAMLWTIAPTRRRWRKAYWRSPERIEA